MKQRSSEVLLIIVLMALFAVLTGWLLNSAHDPDTEEMPSLSTLSPRPDGAMALYELLEEAGYEPQRYHGNEYHFPEHACMVLMYSAEIDFEALFGGSVDPKALRLWLEDGGRLLLVCGSIQNVASALFEELELGSDEYVLSYPHVTAQGGTQGEQGKIAASNPIYSTGYIYRLPATRPPLFHDVTAIEAVPQADPLSVRADLLLGGKEANGEILPIAYHARAGDGELICLTTPEICSNAWIDRHGNAQLVMALVDFLARDRQLYFNEYVHGFRERSLSLSGLLLKTGGGRLMLTAALLLVLAFAGAAVSPARSVQLLVPRRRQATEMVLAHADLYQRARARFMVAESLVERLRRAMFERLRLSSFPADAQVLDWLRANAPQVPASPDLEAYLQDKLLPTTGRELLLIARGCDRAREALERMSRGTTRTGR